MKKDTLYNFGNLVLTDNKLKKYLSFSDYRKFKKLKQYNGEMKFELADKIAKAIKKWALSMGATHYSHWFFPLTGKYAEKHISFIDQDFKNGFIKKFDGNALIKGETDASSFPSGGERLTFEARGYTIWDYSSPVFIKTDDSGNKVVYIPTAFCTYNEVAVDEKTPLLRSIEFLNKETTTLLHHMGYTSVKGVSCNVGCEQEYFLVDKDKFNQRKDLVYTGRTLLGSDAIKTQKTSFHYLGQIKSSVSAFMHDLNRELWEVGIMAKIQHNEAAPSQHEIVTVYSQANIVADQNSLLMEIMNKVADRHGFKVLFHEKPYKNINGSGKHNNWSISTDTGINLLDYNINNKLLFMTTFTSVISAIDKHYDLLKLSTSSLSNDLRLGGHEAPPSIISVFIGDDMSEILNDFAKNNTFTNKKKGVLDIKTSKVAKLYKDTCDRNRTSPFAFTGNKFEFRMVGSSQSIAMPNTILATIVANEFKTINDKLSNLNSLEEKEKLIKEIIVNNIKNHSRIIFNGNSYSKEWHKEAKTRGLINYNNPLDSYSRLINKDNEKLFETCGIFTKAELKVRYETYIDSYINDSMLEAKTLINMCKTQIFPSIENHILNIEKINGCLSIHNSNNLSKKYIELKKLIEVLHNNVLENNKLNSLEEKIKFCQTSILKNMEDIRNIYDEIEPEFTDTAKPFPNYNDLLF